MNDSRNENMSSDEAEQTPSDLPVRHDDMGPREAMTDGKQARTKKTGTPFSFVSRHDKNQSKQPITHVIQEQPILKSKLPLARARPTSSQPAGQPLGHPVSSAAARSTSSTNQIRHGAAVIPYSTTLQPHFEHSVPFLRGTIDCVAPFGQRVCNG